MSMQWTPEEREALDALPEPLRAQLVAMHREQRRTSSWRHGLDARVPWAANSQQPYANSQQEVAS